MKAYPVDQEFIQAQSFQAWLLSAALQNTDGHKLLRIEFRNARKYQWPEWVNVRTPFGDEAQALMEWEEQTLGGANLSDSELTAKQDELRDLVLRIDSHVRNSNSDVSKILGSILSSAFSLGTLRLVVVVALCAGFAIKNPWHWHWYYLVVAIPFLYWLAIVLTDFIGSLLFSSNLEYRVWNGTPISLSDVATAIQNNCRGYFNLRVIGVEKLTNSEAVSVRRGYERRSVWTYIKSTYLRPPSWNNPGTHEQRGWKITYISNDPEFEDTVWVVSSIMPDCAICNDWCVGDAVSIIYDQNGSFFVYNHDTHFLSAGIDPTRDEYSTLRGMAPCVESNRAVKAVASKIERLKSDGVLSLAGELPRAKHYQGTPVTYPSFSRMAIFRNFYDVTCLRGWFVFLSAFWITLIGIGIAIVGAGIWSLVVHFTSQNPK